SRVRRDAGVCRYAAAERDQAARGRAVVGRELEGRGCRRGRVAGGDEPTPSHALAGRLAGSTGVPAGRRGAGAARAVGAGADGGAMRRAKGGKLRRRTGGKLALDRPVEQQREAFAALLQL